MCRDQPLHLWELGFSVFNGSGRAYSEGKLPPILRESCHPFGVNPIDWTTTWRDLGHLPSMLFFKIHRAEVTQCRMESFLIVDPIQEPR